MSAQAKISVGIGTDPWHQRVGKRVRFTADINGRREVFVGRVRWASSTAALIKLQSEEHNDKGKLRTCIVEVPTDLVTPGSVRELKPGEAA